MIRIDIETWWLMAARRCLRVSLAWVLMAPALVMACGAVHAVEAAKPSEVTKPADVPKPDPKAAPGAKAEVPLEPKAKMAVKLAGLVAFVASSCPELKPDYERFRSAIGRLGLSTADLEKNDLKSVYLGYALRYKNESVMNCARALKDFGPAGNVIADLIKPKAK